VFPDAEFKFYLDASPEVRVERRAAQLEANGKPSSRDDVLKALFERDERDRNREWGALRLAEDAKLIDTTGMDEDAVVELICAIVREHPIFRHEAAASR
jgi:cytidylate kinase